MSILIELEEVTEIKGEEHTVKRTVEGKLNYHAMKLSATYYDNLNSGLEAGDSGRVTMIEAYNNLVMRTDDSFTRIVELLWFMFHPKQNGGLSLETIEDFVNETGETEEGFDNLVEEVLNEMEISGFFIKTLRQNYKGTVNHLIPMTKEHMVNPRTGEISPEGTVLLEKLNVLTTRGVEKGFLKESDLESVES